MLKITKGGIILYSKMLQRVVMFFGITTEYCRVGRNVYQIIKF